jgi:hypothetical protein
MAEVRIVALTVSENANDNVGSASKAFVEQALREYVGWKLHTMAAASKTAEGITLVFAMVPDPDYAVQEPTFKAAQVPVDVPG